LKLGFITGDFHLFPIGEYHAVGRHSLYTFPLIVRVVLSASPGLFVQGLLGRGEWRTHVAPESGASAPQQKWGKEISGESHV